MTETKNMLFKICSFYDKKYALLAEIFKSTLKDDYQVCLREIKNSISGSDVWVQKTRLVIEAISENMNDYVVFSDVDIQFFRKTRPLIESLFGKDMLIQWQVGGFGNIGFMVILCSEKTKAFFEQVLDRCILGEWDQKVVNDKLLQNELSWAFLPRSFYAFHAQNPVAPKNAVLHHATWEYNAHEKIRQMKMIKRQLCCLHS